MKKIIQLEKLNKDHSFLVDTLCLGGGIYTDLRSNGFNHIDNMNKQVLEQAIGFLPQTSINISEVCSCTDKYAITYIEKSGEMKSILNLKMLEVFYNLGMIASVVESEDYINIYNMKEGLPYEEFKRKILQMDEVPIVGGSILKVRDKGNILEEFDVIILDNKSAGNGYNYLVMDICGEVLRECKDVEDFKSFYSITKYLGRLYDLLLKNI